MDFVNIVTQISLQASFTEDVLLQLSTQDHFNGRDYFNHFFFTDARHFINVAHLSLLIKGFYNIVMSSVMHGREDRHL